MLNLFPGLSLAFLPDPELAAGLGGTEGPDLTRYFTVCAILIVVTGLVAWGSRRLFAGSLKQRAAKRSLQTLDVLPLGGKQKLVVVRCYDRVFALGVGDREVCPIAELDSVEAPRTATPPPSKANDAAFAQALEAVREAMPKKELARNHAALGARAQDTLEVASPRKKVVRKKVRKTRTRSSAPATRPAKPQVRTQDVAEVAAAARELAADKAQKRAAREQKPAIKAPQPKAPQPKALRLEGILG